MDRLADLRARHGSPLWLADVDRAVDALHALRGALRDAWGDVEVAYSYKTNRLGAFLSAFADEGAHAEVVCEAEYRLARALGLPGERIVVNGPALPGRLLVDAADAGALVVADSADGMGRILDAGVRRVGVRVTQPGATGATSRFGVPERDVPAVVARARAAGAGVEALHAHSVSTDLVDVPGDVPLASRVRVRWPRPAGDHVRLAQTLGRLARELAVPAVDLGGGQPGPDGAVAYAGAVAAALRGAGFAGTVMVEPGRALVADAVDLVAEVAAVRALDDGRRLVVLDAGTNLLPGVLWSWPRVEAPGVAGEPAPALVTGPLCLNVDVLHPAAHLPPLAPGDAVVFRGVGAYHQAQSTQFGDVRPAVLARRAGVWDVARRRESVADLVAPEFARTVHHPLEVP